MSDQLQRITKLRKEAEEAISGHREAVGRRNLPGGIPKYSEGRHEGDPCPLVERSL